MIFIPYNVPSSKNSKQWTGKMLISNPQTLRYKKNAAYYYIQYSKEFINKTINHPSPLCVGFHFIRDSKRKFDFPNACQIVLDMMVAHGWVQDDNCDILLPLPIIINNSAYSVDKNKPGVFIMPLPGYLTLSNKYPIQLPS